AAAPAAACALFLRRQQHRRTDALGEQLRVGRAAAREHSHLHARQPDRGFVERIHMGPLVYAVPKAKSRPGAAAISARVYSWRGWTSTSLAGPVSTTRPWCMTATSSQTCAATRRSWVMNTMA